MDSYTLIARMHRVRRRFRLTAVEQALYHELISVCNGEGWRDVFECSNGELCNSLCINEKTVVKARETLINAGLIFYRSGKSKRTVSSYSFNKNFQTTVTTTVNNTVDKPTDRPTDKGVDRPTNSTDLLKHKTKIKTETILKIKKRRVRLLNKVSEKQVKEEFEIFRKMYPGNKRGAETEFENFKNKNKSDFKELVFLLRPALEKMQIWRLERQDLNQFVPEYANLQTWINQRRWEYELEITENNGQTAISKSTFGNKQHNRDYPTRTDAENKRAEREHLGKIADAILQHNQAEERN